MDVGGEGRGGLSGQACCCQCRQGGHTYAHTGTQTFLSKGSEEPGTKTVDGSEPRESKQRETAPYSRVDCNQETFQGVWGGGFPWSLLGIRNRSPLGCPPECSHAPLPLWREGPLLG